MYALKDYLFDVKDLTQVDNYLAIAFELYKFYDEFTNMTGNGAECYFLKRI